MRIEKKIWPEYFQAIMDGTKTFELRLADFDCSTGDTLVLREWDPQKEDYTGRELEREVTYVVRTKDQPFFTAEDVEKYGFQVISFR